MALKEDSLATAIYNLLKLTDSASSFDKSIIAEEIGKILIEAKRHDIYKTTLALAGLYLDDLERETRQRVRRFLIFYKGNNNFIKEETDADNARRI